MSFLPSKTPPVPGRRRGGASRGPDAPKRQTASDQRWEGDTWLSSAELAQNIDKRTRASVPALLQPLPKGIALPPGMPQKPEDPQASKNPTSRRRDKDRIPSAEMYVPDLHTLTWVLVPRPIVHQVGLFRAYRPLPPQQLALLQRLVALRAADRVSPAIDTEFLGKHLVPRLSREHPASLRTLDWLVVDYAREMGVAYTWPVFGVPRVVVIHPEYIQYLAAHRRRHFDVFRRRHRVYFDVDGETYSTTAAQLHFFYIAFHLGILHYAETAAADIKAHMKSKLAANAAIKEAALLACPDKAPGRSALVGRSDLHAYSVEGGTVKEFFTEQNQPHSDDDDEYEGEGEGSENDDEDNEGDEDDEEDATEYEEDKDGADGADDVATTTPTTTTTTTAMAGAGAGVGVEAMAGLGVEARSGSDLHTKAEGRGYGAPLLGDDVGTFDEFSWSNV